ncbi:hypothetical protein LSTR_LSTR016756 [Laodelphax striatellus]|uniref:Histone deacetylase domain-containing protein n=1 Tax=Laodelphax striatellus TaxID=195883 RepID=A0A482WPD5_LAOST|nr:hypothetical protein LSTR_LSTR016756 [Laodelphax striatellus]
MTIFVKGNESHLFIIYFFKAVECSRLSCDCSLDIGAGKGKYYAVNIPLRDGMDDESYESIFVPIISKVMETFQPSAVVLQCGADSLTGDRLGCFNLTVRGELCLMTILVASRKYPFHYNLNIRIEANIMS